MKDITGLEHTKQRCQYHVVFAPKYRRQAIYREIKADIGFILRKLCNQRGVEVIEANACPDHIHMLISIPPKFSVSQIMGYLKGKSSLMIFDRHANLTYNYGNRYFWARGYYADTVGRNKKQIQEYIQNQLKEDQIADQMTLKEYVDLLNGQQVTAISEVRPLYVLRRRQHHRALPTYEIPPAQPGDLYYKETTCYASGTEKSANPGNHGWRLSN